MYVEITLNSLLIGLLIIVSVVALVLLSKVLLRLNEALKQLQQSLQRNGRNIDEALEILPIVLQNVEAITKSVNDEMEQVSSALKSIGETVEYTASTAQVINDDIVLPVKEVLEILELIRSIFRKEKKRGLFSK